ncbi:MAG: response regulator transcription factor, partial [Eubacterium sp.]|nr:response regulator transcription factor [Eubacterium sp.]
QEAIKIWEAERVDMVLLDINLPDGSGYELLKKIRKQSEIPVLMITANDMEVDEVMGFTLGADDYITKPFSLMVLRARVERMRKRSGETKKQEIYRDEVYDFNFDKMLFLKEGEEVTLSKTEQKLLRVLTQHREQTLTREQLMDAIWSNDAEFVDENALSVAVNRLRRKLESRQGDCPIQTVYGLGYVWKKKAEGITQ